MYIKIKNDVPLTHDVFKTLNAFFFPITSALHYFSYPQRLTVSFNVCEHHQVNHNIFTLSSPAQAKVNLPLVHYRHDTGIPPPLGPSGEGRDVGCGGEREEGGALRGFFMQLCVLLSCCPAGN